MIKITLKDGSVIEVAKDTPVTEIVSKISEGLARVALIAKFNGELIDLSRKLEEDGSLEILTFKDDEGKNAYRHTAAHILAQAVKNIYPNAKLAIGPSIANGFYYDFDFETPITIDDFEMIEKEMQSIIKADLPIERTEVSRQSALIQMRGFNEPYKIQLIEDLPKDSTLTFYRQGAFTELCRGPHLLSTGKVKFIKLTQLAGAYWRGNEKNKMLTRIYGTAFDKKSDLTEYIEKLEEAKRRDHNKIGRELGYFMTEDKIGQGLPLLMPKGAKLFQILQRFVEDEQERRGYMLTNTPSFAKSDLYKISGHWDHYLDKMFVIGDPEKDKEVFALRPMTCPFQYMIYNNGLKSYRDLPCRYHETSPLFRKEASGEMHGLIRVREFHLADSHVVCTPEQVEDEFRECFDLNQFYLKSLGMLDDVKLRFSRWDPADTDKYINEPERWEQAESSMKRILDDMKVDYYEAKGEAAFYGPKLDIQATNVYGKEDTIMTIQIDMMLARNFDMWYVDQDGEKKHPYIIHCGVFGCYERMMALILEKYAGALPLWISPTQVKIMSLTDRTSDDAKKLALRLREQGIRCEVDVRNEKIGYKIREAQLEKVPYMIILGDKEKENEVVAVRSRNAGDLGTMTEKEFVDKLTKEITEKVC
ncbi:threonine--tRNA ligase 2 [Firmicutes bacterium CAG:552]|nr:MAG: threonine--tRNA ligase [Firmicutes bacterium CAG:552_39_19]CDB25669.1 threonine--tRNA ligase 2 [Firmicutes bacterium CAG:552]